MLECICCLVLPALLREAHKSDLGSMIRSPAASIQACVQALADLTRCHLLTPLRHQMLMWPASAAANLPANLTSSGKGQHQQLI